MLILSYGNNYNRSDRPLYQKAPGVSEFWAQSGFPVQFLLQRHNPACVALLTASLCLLRRFAYCVASLAVPHPQGSGDTLQKKCTLDIVDALRL
jgi:hypothetical protein